MSLGLTKYHATKTYGGVKLQQHAFLISALDGGKWSASRSGRFNPRETGQLPTEHEARVLTSDVPSSQQKLSLPLLCVSHSSAEPLKNTRSSLLYF
jgi:flagellar basal body rod protein FlgG